MVIWFKSYDERHCSTHILFGIVNEILMTNGNTNVTGFDAQCSISRKNSKLPQFQFWDGGCLGALHMWNVADLFCKLKTLGFCRKLPLKFVLPSLIPFSVEWSDEWWINWPKNLQWVFLCNMGTVISLLQPVVFVNIYQFTMLQDFVPEIKFQDAFRISIPWIPLVIYRCFRNTITIFLLLAWLYCKNNKTNQSKKNHKIVNCKMTIAIQTWIYIALEQIPQNKLFKDRRRW